MPVPVTKNLVEVSDIRENILILKNGSLRALMEVTAINFELRSEEEQNAILQNFQNFLNAVDFPIQIVINSRTFNIDEYIKTVEASTAPLTNELLKLQAAEYMKFIRELAELANIMSKKFYIVIPFYLSAVGSGKGIMDIFSGVFSKKKVSTGIPEEQFASAKNQIMQRAELIFDGLVGMGMKTRILERQDLLNTFYELYNPGSKSKV
jgi:type IV secretory pathway VirB4 component